MEEEVQRRSMLHLDDNVTHADHHTNCTDPNGTAVDCTAHNGTASNCTAPDGTATNCTAHNGTASNSTNGTAPAPAPGRAVQVDPIKPMLKAPGTERLQLEYNKPPSNFAFKFSLRRYILARPPPPTAPIPMAHIQTALPATALTAMTLTGTSPSFTL
jgi:hypothetical protein